MEKSNTLERLIMFGLTRQEASVYVALYQNGELTGYEAAKITGISRSNAYSALSGLVDKGAAYLAEGVSSKYIAVAVEEFCDNKIRMLQTEKKYLIAHIPMMKESCEGYITIEGYNNILNKIHHMILHAEQRVYFLASTEMIPLVRCELETIITEGKKVVLLLDDSTDIKGALVYITNKKEKQVRLITDSSYVLTGEVTGDSRDTCLYSGQKNFVNVFKEALRNEIKLIELTKGEKENE